jgi:hypothetical protein
MLLLFYIQFFSLMPCCTEKYKLSHIHNFTHEIFFLECSQIQTTLSLSLSEHKEKHGIITSECIREIKMKSAQLLYKFPISNYRSRSSCKMKERQWKIRSTKVVADSFKQELLNRLKSTTAVKMLIHILSCTYIYWTKIRIHIDKEFTDWIIYISTVNITQKRMSFNYQFNYCFNLYV